MDGVSIAATFSDLCSILTAGLSRRAHDDRASPAGWDHKRIDLLGSLILLLTPDPEPSSGSVRIVVIMTVAGLIVGLIRHFLKTEEVNVFGAMVTGGSLSRTGISVEAGAKSRWGGVFSRV